MCVCVCVCVCVGVCMSMCNCCCYNHEFPCKYVNCYSVYNFQDGNVLNVFEDTRKWKEYTFNLLQFMKASEGIIYSRILMMYFKFITLLPVKFITLLKGWTWQSKRWSRLQELKRLYSANVWDQSEFTQTSWIFLVYIFRIIIFLLLFDNKLKI